MYVAIEGAISKGMATYTVIRDTVPEQIRYTPIDGISFSEGTTTEYIDCLFRPQHVTMMKWSTRLSPRRLPNMMKRHE